VKLIKTTSTLFNCGRLALLGVLAVAALVPARAEVNLVLYSTGVGSTGPITQGNPDPYFNVISSPGAGCDPDGTGCSVPPNTSTQATVVDLSPNFPFPYWSSNNTSSQWISLTPGNTLVGGAQYSEPAGTFVYQTTFTLPTGFTSANISGLWATDNNGVAISLNGNSELFQSPGALNTFPNGGSFNINSGFQAGTNTLDFSVYNVPQANGNPEGLRVAFTNGTYAPEPGLYALLGIGLSGLFLATRKRRKA
jgi:hypothetical protein